MTAPIIDAPDELTRPVSAGGASAETWSSVTYWATRGVSVIDDPGGRSTIVLPRYLLPLNELERWCSLGSDVLQYDMYHELSDVTKVCPYSTENETWQQWGVGPNGDFAPFQQAGKWYRTNRYAPVGERLAASAWYRYIDAPNTAATGIVRILSIEDFNALPPG